MVEPGDDRRFFDRLILIAGVLNGTYQSPLPANGAGPTSRCTLETRPRRQASVVEKLRRETADRRRKPPRFGQEEPAIRRHRLRATENVLQHRDGRGLRMTALERLFELLRIPEEHEVARAATGGGDVRESHLPGFVHDKHVDGRFHVLPRPQPRGAAGDMPLAVREHSQHFAVICRLTNRTAIVVGGIVA